MARTRVNGTGGFTKDAPPLPGVVTLTPEEQAKAQAWLEDRVVRAIREKGYCGESLAVLEKVFPDGPLDKVGVYDTRGVYGQGYGSKRSARLYWAYLDSDGKDCWNNVWRDVDGYDRDGFDAEGYDRDGFGREGYNRDGFNREGRDANGVSRDDPARFMYDALGFDKDGYNREGFDRYGFNREGVDASGRPRQSEAYVFDSRGFDQDGFNIFGYDRSGAVNSEAYEKYRSYRRRAGL